MQLSFLLSFAAPFINMDESFILRRYLNKAMIEQVAQIPNADNITVCSCRGICLRERGRNACPCKSITNTAQSACHLAEDANSNMCMNTRRVLESDESDRTSDSDFLEEPTVSFV